MQKTFCLAGLLGAFFLGGCDKQTQANTEKIEALSHKILQLQINQARQLEAVQTQLAALPPMLEKTKNAYLARSHDEALFYHTNMVYLLLSMDKKIGSQFQMVQAERDAESSLAFYYHTNQTGTIFFCTAQIQDALAGQETRIENTINSEVRRVGNSVGDEVVKQIKLLAPDQAEIDRRRAMEARLAQIQRELELINARLRATNPPAGRF